MKKLFAIIGLFGISLFFAPKASAQYFMDQTYTDGIYVENATGTKAVMPLPSVREADVMWKKTIWREIDFRQKMNQGFYYPTVSHQNWKNFITVITDAMKEGRITAYNDEPTGELLNPISYSQVMSKQTDTLYRTFRRPYPPYDEYDTVIISQFDPSQVKRCRIKEEWYFDKQRSQLMVRILALCPVKMIELENGESVPQPMFWIPYESAREVLSQAPFYNRSNSAARLSYDEVFLKRMFDSYIYKEENIFDRNIKEYAQGVDALIESERIKQSIIDFEQNLWEY